MAGRPELQRDAIPAAGRILPAAHIHARMEFFPQDWYKAIAQQEAPLSREHSTEQASKVIPAALPARLYLCLFRRGNATVNNERK